MKNNIQIAIILLAATGIFAQQPSQAYVSDTQAVGHLQDAKNDLLIRETKLIRDQDDLNKQIYDLKRMNDGRSTYMLNDLCQRLDSKFVQLQKTRWELKQINQTLL